MRASLLAIAMLMIQAIGSAHEKPVATQDIVLENGIYHTESPFCDEKLINLGDRLVLETTAAKNCSVPGKVRQYLRQVDGNYFYDQNPENLIVPRDTHSFLKITPKNGKMIYRKISNAPVPPVPSQPVTLEDGRYHSEGSQCDRIIVNQGDVIISELASSGNVYNCPDIGELQYFYLQHDGTFLNADPGMEPIRLTPLNPRAFRRDRGSEPPALFRKVAD